MSLVSGLLTETLSYKRKTGHSAAGDPTFAAPATMPARIERQQGTVTTGDGTLLEFSSRVFTEAAVKLDDLLFFAEDSTASNDTARKPMRVDEIRGLDGAIDHYETYL